MNIQHKQSGSDKQGFTIIEVVLVLAIAGLIFLMVFLALPALQRGQRDTQRKDDLSRINTQLQNFSSSSRGSIPSSSTFANFVKQYLGAKTNTTSGCAGVEYRDPNKQDTVTCTGPDDGYKLTFVATGGGSQAPDEGEINYQPGTLCNTDGGGGTTTTGASARSYTATIKLENQTAPYCIDNR